MDALCANSEEERKRMEEQDKPDLEAMPSESQAMEAADKARVMQLQVTLTSKVRELESRSEKILGAEMLIKQQIEADRQHFEKEKQDAQTILEELNRLTQVHAEMQCKQRDKQKEIIRVKHEGELERTSVSS